MNQSKHRLAYDFQEPVRFIVDMASINLIEKGDMDNKDFIRNESYSLRHKPSGSKKVTGEFNKWMNKKGSLQKAVCYVELCFVT